MKYHIYIKYLYNKTKYLLNCIVFILIYRTLSQALQQLEDEFDILEDARKNVTTQDVAKHNKELNKNKKKKINDKDEQDNDENDDIAEDDIDLNLADNIEDDEKNKKQQGVLKTVESPNAKKKKKVKGKRKDDKKKEKKKKDEKRKEKKTKKTSYDENNIDNNRNNKNNKNNNNRTSQGSRKYNKNNKKIKIDKFNKLYVTKGSGGGGKLSFVVQSKIKISSSSNYSHKVIGGALTPKEKSSLIKSGININIIFKENKRIGWGTVKKPLFHKKSSMMTQFEKRFRRYMLNKELEWEKKKSVAYFGDWIDWNNFTYEEIHFFFTKFSPKFNFNQLLTIFKMSRSHNS